jgi:hypothetical protein
MVSLMRGVESIIGAYLAVIIVISVVTGLYLYILKAGRSVDEQIREAIVNYQSASYPPVLSLSYVNDTTFKLSITPYNPLYIEEAIAKEIDGELIYSVSVNEVLYKPRELEVVINKTPATILLVSNKGVVFYYIPRQDPGLLTAPDYIRNKPFIDDELIEYLKRRSNNTQSGYGNTEPTGSITPLDYIGYKVSSGKTNRPTSLLLNGPISCPPWWTSPPPLDAYSPCNVNATDYGAYYSILTYNYNKTYWYFDNEGYLNISSELASINIPGAYKYIQVLRLIKFASPGLYTILFSVRFETGPISSTYQANNTALSVVLYILRGDADLNNYIALSTPEQPTTSWLRRVLIDYKPQGSLEIKSISYGVVKAVYSSNNTVSINLSNLGFNEYIVAYGVEVTFPWSGSIRVKIDLVSVEKG